MRSCIDIIGTGMCSDVVSIHMKNNQAMAWDSRIKTDLLPVFTQKILIRSRCIVPDYILVGFGIPECFRLRCCQDSWGGPSINIGFGIGIVMCGFVSGISIP